MNQQMFRHVLQTGRKINCCRTLYNHSFTPSFLIRDDPSKSRLCAKRITTEPRSVGFNDTGILNKVARKMKFNFKKYKLRAAGYCLYEKVADELDFRGFMRELELPDTFQSWFLLTELHVWMIMSRLMADFEHGRFVRNCVVEALWQDVSTRSKKLGSENTQAVRDQVQEMSEQFQAALVSYDEGLLSSDIVLAGAIWRRLLNRKNDPEKLELMLKYVRKTMLALDKVEMEEFIMKKNFEWFSVDQVFKKSN